MAPILANEFATSSFFPTQGHTRLENVLDYVQLGAREQEIQRIADKHDIRLEKEGAFQSIRRITPGDHKEKLRPKMIE